MYIMNQMDKKKRSVNIVDATGKQVAANVKRLRAGMTYKELSERMSRVQRPLTVLALRRIEAGERKVDVDDLMAFAVVFGVSPLTLLLPEYGSYNFTTKVTGYPHEIGDNVAWLWARGDEPLELPDDTMSRDQTGNKRAIETFQFKSKPEISDRSTAVPVVSFVPEDPVEAEKDSRESLSEAFRLSRAQRAGVSDEA